MAQLYPLKFEPVLKSRPWGGNNLSLRFGKTAGENEKTGESWEISGLEGDESVIANGFLAGNNITEIIEVYMGDVLGERVYDVFGDEFPLLVKLIDAAETLSVQVHPGNEMAARLHNAYGKTEMWYIIEAKPDSKIYCGFMKGVKKEHYLEAVEHGTLHKILNEVPVKKDDLFFIPAGMVHAIGEGVVLAEIQQSSDVTYRIYDWNRTDAYGISRELHTELAAEAIKFDIEGGKVDYPDPGKNRTIQLVRSPYFVTSLLNFDTFVTKNYNLLDSFVILLCTEGKYRIHWENGSDNVAAGETILIPATAGEIVLEPLPGACLLEIYMNNGKATE